MGRNSKFNMQTAKGWCLHSLVVLHFAFCMLHDPGPAYAQAGETVAEIVVEQEGRPVTDPAITGLIINRVGAPLSMADVRETEAHLTSLNRFDDVQVMTENVPG